MSPYEDAMALSKANGGEESMQSFISDHIATIMEPVSARVRELEQQLEHLSKDLALTDTKVEQSQALLDQHDRELLTVRTANGQMATRVDKMQIELTKEAEARHKAEREHDASKQGLAKANERQQHCMASVESLERKLGQLSSNVGGLRDTLQEAERCLQGQAKHVAALRDAHEDLGIRHQDTSNRVEEASLAGERTERDLQRLAKNWRHQSEEDARSIAELATSAKQIQHAVDSNRDLTEQQGAELRLTTTLLQQTRTILDAKDGISRRVESLIAKDMELAEAIRKNVENFERLEKMVDILNEDMRMQKAPGAGGSSEVIDDLKLRLEAATNDVAKLTRGHQRHSDCIKETAACSERLVRDQKRFQERADATEEELVGLLAAHKQASKRLDAHALDQQRLQADVVNIARELDSGMVQVKGDLGSASTTLAKLRSHFDACNQNFYGLAKGFQDAGKSAGASPEAGQKVNRQRPLPPVSTPRTPRTPSRAPLNDTLNALPHS